MQQKRIFLQLAHDRFMEKYLKDSFHARYIRGLSYISDKKCINSSFKSIKWYYRLLEFSKCFLASLKWSCALPSSICFFQESVFSL